MLLNKILFLNPSVNAVSNKFLFQKSFRSRFLSVAEVLHEEGFKVGGFSSLKLESFQNMKCTQPAAGMKNFGVY